MGVAGESEGHEEEKSVEAVENDIVASQYDFFYHCHIVAYRTRW